MANLALKLLETVFAQAVREAQAKGDIPSLSESKAPIAVIVARSDYGRAPGWMQVRCEQCREILWVSPTLQQQVAAKPDTAFHYACVRHAATVAARVGRDVPGICRQCYCQEDHACILENGVPCAWANEARTLCTNPECLRKEAESVAIQ